MKKFIAFCILLLSWFLVFQIQAQTNYEPYVFTTLAGNHPGYTDGSLSEARFDGPTDLAIDSMGNFFVADSDNDIIRKVTPAGVVTTFAGVANSVGSSDGTGNVARFNRPGDIAIDGSNNVYVADSGNNTIRKITPAGVVTTFAGSAGNTGSNDGIGSAARFNFPTGLAFDGLGNLYVVDSINDTIRKITAAASVTTLAGAAGIVGSSDGFGSAARFNRPRRVTLDNAGNLVVSDTTNQTIRKITPAGNVTTLAGSAGQGGHTEGTGNLARFRNPRGLAVDSANNIYVADTSNLAIRKITPNAVVSTFVDYTAGWNRPYGLAFDRFDNLFLSDYYDQSIYKITPAAVVSVFAGSVAPGFVNGLGTNARFNYPAGPAMDSMGNIFVAELNNNVIRKITPAGLVSTFAGSGDYGFADGDGNIARFATPTSVAVDSSDNLYVADWDNNVIRKITPNAIVSTLAGSPTEGGSADGPGPDARFSAPAGVATDSAGNVYVADLGNNTIRKITPENIVSTLAGLAGSSGSEDGMGSAARFNNPNAVAVDSAGNIFVSDGSNSTIRKVTPSGSVTTIAGTAGMIGTADGNGSAARFNFNWGIAVDSGDNVFVVDSGNYTIRKITPAGVVTTLGGIPAVLGWNDGVGTGVRFNFPVGIAVNASGKIYVADSFNYSIRSGVPQLRLINAVSRKTHGAAGTFDITLPLTGTAGVECRSSGGNHTFVFTFSNNPVSANVSVTGGTGTVTGSPTFAGRTMTVNVTGVTDAQTLTLMLNNTTDNFSQVLPSTSVSAKLLIGDTNGNGAVNASDVGQTKTQSGTATAANNFRNDVNLSGSVNASDVSLVKSRSGNGVPLTHATGK
jgi:hypothetical protein